MSMCPVCGAEIRQIRTIGASRPTAVDAVPVRFYRSSSAIKKETFITGSGDVMQGVRTSMPDGILGYRSHLRTCRGRL